MDWIETPESSNIVRYSYDAETKTLYVEFKGGGTYKYFDVPKKVFTQMKAASSVGTFLSNKIKGMYEYERTVFLS